MQLRHHDDFTKEGKEVGTEWRVHLMLFSRHGGTSALRAGWRAKEARLLTYENVVRDLTSPKLRRSG